MSQWQTTRPPRQFEEIISGVRGREEDQIMELAGYCREVARQMGGYQELAKMTVALLKDRATTPEVKRRALENLIGLFRFVEQRMGPPPDLRDSTDEELKAVVAEAVEERERRAAQERLPASGPRNDPTGS